MFKCLASRGIHSSLDGWIYRSTNKEKERSTNEAIDKGDAIGSYSGNGVQVEHEVESIGRVIGDNDVRSSMVKDSS